ncbi:putative non-specific serine/threonine protein kinase [Helianthus anomalus]
MANPTTQITIYNHPCGDLLDGRRSEYLDIAVPLYRAARSGDLKAAKAILQDREYLVRYSITGNKETPLHVAAASHHTKFVRYLVNMMNGADLELRNEDGNTAFCLAAIYGNVDMLKIMIEKNQALPFICGSENKTPLYLAAFHGNRRKVIFLYDQSRRMRGDGWTNDDISEVLLKCIQADIFGTKQSFLIIYLYCVMRFTNYSCVFMFLLNRVIAKPFLGVALQILKDNEQLPEKKHAWDLLHAMARNHAAFHDEDEVTFAQHLLFLVTYDVTIFPRGNEMALPLLTLLWKRIMEKPKDVIDEILKGPMTVVEKDPGHYMETYPSQILFIATKMNSIKFLVVLIREYPDLIWKRNDDEQTIFHVAVSHRHHDIYSLLYEIGSMKDAIAQTTDQQGNNILHLVGKNQENSAIMDWVATPFHMFSEFLWYKEVEGILPPSCREVKNLAGKTPQELFTENHKDLVTDGTKWVNKTINISMVVAALVCTIGFSVVYSIPGGFNQKNGYPMLLRHNYFIAFVVLDVISFFLSTTSIVLFLSVFISRDSGNMKLLLRKWVTGQLLLLGSVCFLVIAFILSFFILYLKSTNWTYITYASIYLLAISYSHVCRYRVVDALRTAYGSKFSPKKPRLYRKQ